MVSINRSLRDFLPIIAIAITFSATVSVISCGGKTTSGGEGDYTSCVPSNLGYRALTGGVYLDWRPNCGQQRSTMGYNFYLHPVGEAPQDFPKTLGAAHNHVPYPGDTDADRSLETAELKELMNGTEYVAVVTILFPDGNESKPSNVLRFSAMNGGEFTLASRYQGSNDGFAFSQNKHVRADNSANDLYLLSRADGDYLFSPSKLGFGLKTVRLSRVGNFGRFTQASGVAGPGGGSEEIKIRPGDVIELRAEDNYSARIFVRELEGSGKGRTVHLEYMRHTVAGKKNF